MRIAICDNENEWVNHIEGHIDHLKKHMADLEYDVFFSGEEILKYYNTHGNIFDIVILDIELTQMSGIELAQKLRDMDSDLIIFFLTSHREYVFDCFKSEPMNFWTKPVSYEDFKEDIKRANKKIYSANQILRITEKRGKVRIKYKDIIYIENKERKSWIYTLQGVHQTNKSLSDLMQELDNKYFVRVYTSYVVNLAYIHVMRNEELLLFNSDTVIPIGRTYKSELVERFIDFREMENFQL